MNSEQIKANVAVLNLVESSHHDLGWHKCSYEAESDFTFDEINTALDLMQKDPSYTWSHECCGYMYAYLKKYPQRYEELRQRVAEGRFDIGAGFAMPYTSFVTAEMLVRLFIYGKKWAEATFPGSKSNVYYNTDVPSLCAQMPQLLKKADVKYLYASRSWAFDELKRNDYKLLRSPDGSEVKTFFMNHYTNNMLPNNDGEMIDHYDYVQERIEEHAGTVEEVGAGHELPMLFCTDCMMPVDFSKRFADWNAYAKEHNLPEMKYSTMQAALDAVFTGNIDLSKDVLSGEWPSKWFYENSASDHETFLKQREAERFLRTTEILAVIRAIATGSFQDYPAEKLEQAWRATDHTCHGYAPEVCIEDFKRVYGQAIGIAREIYEENLNWLVSAVATNPSKGDLCFVLFNNLSWVRDDIVEMARPAGLAEIFRIVDADGQEIPYQVSREGTLILSVKGVPSMGYKVYYIRNGEAPAVSAPVFTVGAAWEKEFVSHFYSVTPVVSGGAVSSILDRENGGKSLFCSSKFKIGELYDFEYNGMGAGEQLNMWQPHDGVSQIGCFAPWTCVESGPIRTVFETTAAAASRGPATVRFTVYETVKRADFQLLLDLDSAEAHQLRLMFPISSSEMFADDGSVDSSNVRVSYEIPFGSVTVGDEMLPKFSSFNENKGDPNRVGNGVSDPRDFTDNSAIRPREVQNWVEASDARRDVSVCFSSYNLGWDYQDATSNPCKTPVLQPIVVSTSKACHWLYGHWLQPGMHSFRFSMTSGKAGSTAGHRMNTAVNNPLAAVVQEKAGSLLPESGCGISVNRDNVVISAVKKAEDDMEHVVVRWYETDGCSCNSDVTVSLPGKVTSASKVNLIERPEANGELCCCGGKINGPVAPCSIETVMASLEEIR